MEALSVAYATEKGGVKAVDAVTFQLERGECLGLAGESGSGKSSVAAAILGLLPPNGAVQGGRVRFDGLDLLAMTEEQLNRVRWKRIAVIFQRSMNSLNPVYKVKDQILEALFHHEPRLSVAEANARVAGLFQAMDIPLERMDAYPHEYSGGMRQRAAIAMALAGHPEVVIADEPTTALDVIAQRRVVRALDQARQERGAALLYISHDLALLSGICDRIGVMYAGRLVEIAAVPSLFQSPLHPYAKALQDALPRLEGAARLAPIPGESPDPLAPPPGCAFHPRCPFASERCRIETPTLREHRPGHWAACWHPLEDAGARRGVGRS